MKEQIMSDGKSHFTDEETVFPKITQSQILSCNLGLL